MSHWRRPPGPPAVYKVIDGRYSVQEIPTDGPRRQEVLDNLREYYLADEPLAKCTSELPGARTRTRGVFS